MALVCLFLAACVTSPSYSDTAFRCDVEFDCPDSQICGSDKQCGALPTVGLDAGEAGDTSDANEPIDAADPPSCGDANVDDGELCDDGASNSDAWSSSATCNASCTEYAPRCGDGAIADGFETCDDGNVNPRDGCDAQCAIESRWIKALDVACPAFCATVGLTNVQSAEGHRCASGENIPQSAFDAAMQFPFGCYPNCSPHVAGPNGSSVGNRCYATGQKQDSDPSDRTVACFCGLPLAGG